MKNLYIENYKTILKETKDRNTVEKKNLCPWIWWQNIVELPKFPEVIYRLVKSLPKFTMAYFADMEKVDSEIHMELQGT